MGEGTDAGNHGPPEDKRRGLHWECRTLFQLVRPLHSCEASPGWAPRVLMNAAASRASDPANRSAAVERSDHFGVAEFSGGPSG